MPLDPTDDDPRYSFDAERVEIYQERPSGKLTPLLASCSYRPGSEGYDDQGVHTASWPCFSSRSPLKRLKHFTLDILADVDGVTQATTDRLLREIDEEMRRRRVRWTSADEARRLSNRKF